VAYPFIPSRTWHSLTHELEQYGVVMRQTDEPFIGPENEAQPLRPAARFERSQRRKRRPFYYNGTAPSPTFRKRPRNSARRRKSKSGSLKISRDKTLRLGRSVPPGLDWNATV
jgi:hypothetical protein